MPVTFNIPQVIAIAKGIGAARLEAACVHLVNSIRQNISVPGRTQSQVTISRGKNAGKTRTKWGALNTKPSQPGDFPAKQTGTLRSSIAYTIDKETLTAKVGTASMVGKWLELGTRGGTIISVKNARVLADALGHVFGTRVVQGAILPRPFLTKTVTQERGNLNQIMAGKSV
jgi:hypothetical protein